MTWLLTWTTYGTRLPGDARGFVSGLRTDDGEVVIHNVPGTPVDADVPPLRRYAESVLTQSPVWLTAAQAATVADQFRETAAYRNWELLALAVMANHVHLVVEVPDSVSASKLQTDFKAYTTRRLNGAVAPHSKRKWWTERGSTRALRNPGAVPAAVTYVKNQPGPLVVWLAGDGA
jgi:REP element-mobilizing transposase RayT